MILLSHQYGLGQAILCDVTLQISRQLHGQRTYFFPTGAFFIGYGERDVKKPHFLPHFGILGQISVALISIKSAHLTCRETGNIKYCHCLQASIQILTWQKPNKPVRPFFWTIITLHTNMTYHYGQNRLLQH